jgi:uncharacterized OsmC-like protein
MPPDQIKRFPISPSQNPKQRYHLFLSLLLLTSSWSGIDLHQLLRSPWPAMCHIAVRLHSESRCDVATRKAGRMSLSSVTKRAPSAGLEYRVSAKRIDSHGSVASTKDAEIILDTDVDGRPDAFNPAELFLAAIAACMIKGIERVTPMLKFDLRGVEVKLHGVRRDSPPKMISVDYELIVDTNETDQRLELLHTNVRKYGTISNTVAEATKLEGLIRRRE